MVQRQILERKITCLYAHTALLNSHQFVEPRSGVGRGAHLLWPLCSREWLWSEEDPLQIIKVYKLYLLTPFACREWCSVLPNKAHLSAPLSGCAWNYNNFSRALECCCGILLFLIFLSAKSVCFLQAAKQSPSSLLFVFFFLDEGENTFARRKTAFCAQKEDNESLNPLCPRVARCKFTRKVLSRIQYWIP